MWMVNQTDDGLLRLGEVKKMSKKAIVYINQFFGQVGGEDTADYEPTIHEGTMQM